MIPIFLSYPKPFMHKQNEFIEKLTLILRRKGFEPQTLGVTDYNLDAPLKGIRELMINSYGLIAVAFKRYYIEYGEVKKGSDIDILQAKKMNNIWMTSPYSHIEPAMAFQLGLPILIFRGNNVLDDGILEKGVLGIYMPVFNLENNIDEYLNSQEFIQLLDQWSLKVHEQYKTKKF